jgi:hypothetical protein
MSFHGAPSEPQKSRKQALILYLLTSYPIFSFPTHRKEKLNRGWLASLLFVKIPTLFPTSEIIIGVILAKSREKKKPKIACINSFLDSKVSAG